MKKLFFVSIICLTAALFASCSKIMGHSVLLWNLPDYEMQDGDIVPVYIKSNISHVYVIGTANGKMEVPLWQLTEPVSKRKAAKQAQKFSGYTHVYASVALDGLPIRAEPVNTAKQGYRLRKDETIKVLYKGQGQAVMAGKKPLEGDWLNVLTSDGTRGWCFSYNLRLFETDRLGQKITNGAEASEEENTSSEIDTLLEGVWYPDSYKAMIDSGRIDTDKLIPSYNFHLDPETKKLSFTMPKIREEWEYTGAVQTSANQYNLNDIPVVVTVRRSNFIVVRYTGESGKPEDFNLVTISENIDELVQAERERREKELEQIILFAPSFQSESYGQLKLNPDHSFVWSNNKLLVPSVISSSARNTGTVRIKYFLSKSLSASYDGVLTFKFDGMEKEVNFLYKMESSGLRFEDATGAVIKNNILMERALSPLVLFFSKGE